MIVAHLRRASSPAAGQYRATLLFGQHSLSSGSTQGAGGDWEAATVTFTSRVFSFRLAHVRGDDAILQLERLHDGIVLKLEVHALQWVRHMVADSLDAILHDRRLKTDNVGAFAILAHPKEVSRAEQRRGTVNVATVITE
jgi:hypothetical protein